MPNKNWNRLNPIDLDLRIVNHVGMEDGIKQLILRQCGFELYNTRPYHNYETWSDGWIVIGRRDGKAMSISEAQKLLTDRTDRETYIFISREDLDEAVNEFIKQIYGKDDLKERRTKLIAAGIKNEKRRRY